MSTLLQRYQDACDLARDYLAGTCLGGCTAQQALAALLRAGGDAYADGAAGAFLVESIERGDQLVETLLLACGVCLVGDPPRREPPTFTLGGTDQPTRAVTPRERALVHDVRIQHLLVSGIDPWTQRSVCWAVELNRNLELHARAAHAGCRRRAFLHKLRTRTPEFVSLLQKTTGVQL